MEYHKEGGGGDPLINEFNDWLDDVEVLEPPCIGSKYTWYRPNGTARSKLDRVFISSDWLSKWPASTQHILDKNFSDHCPMLVKSKNADWGPKSFRLLDCWLKDKSFGKVVKDSWTQTQQTGWSGYVLKEKIKCLKERIKLWNKEQNGDTFKKFQNIEAELNKLENDIAKRQMTPQESLNRKRLQQDLWRAALSHKSLMRQKARSRWIKEGDCNSRYFHLMINSNHKSNAVTGVSMARGWRNQTE